MFFLSGMGALVFETVWFNQLGLVVGNSVWSVSLVVAAFMAGLALGNASAPWLARRWRNLVRGYAAVEVLAALSGLAVVLAFPVLPLLFGPLLAPFVDQAAALNVLRLGTAFCLMVLPAAALGATLPLLSRPLEAASGSYGFALGRLYGINTLGAVAGTLAAEMVLIPALGLQASGLAAAACNLGAAGIALAIAGDPAFHQGKAPEVARRAPRRLLAAAFLGGALLLALEVLWFRLMLLFESGTTLLFATLLAVVLAGIGLGGMLAARLARRGWSPAAAARLSAAAAAGGVVAGYAAIPAHWVFLVTSAASHPLTVSTLQALVLMGPVSLASGVLFTALGDALRRETGDAAAATARLTAANTIGAMAGALLSAFVLLPLLGMEAAYFVLAALYGLVVLLVPGERSGRAWRLVPAAAAAAALALFPFGRMAGEHYRRVEEHFGARLVAAREGAVETAFYLAYDFLGETAYHRLVTNSYSMSSTSPRAQRYMRLFAYLPAALHPRIERALVICFGVGSTADAVTDLPDVKAIDVVDVSSNVLALADFAYPDPKRHPLRDPRVRTHVEDGRFFLQHTAQRYDLITAEPPPPKVARIVSLYTREYFELLKSRLNPGGIASYWLTVHQLLPGETLAVVHAFCDAFEDCSLWSGVGLEWILVGSRGGIAPVPRERVARLFEQEPTRTELRRIALERPQHLVAQFIADAAALRAAAAQAPPLVDDFPRRLSATLPSGRAEPLYAELVDAAASHARLRSSAWAAAVLPGELLAQGPQAFREREMLDALGYPELREPGSSAWGDVAEVMRGGARPALARWLLGSDELRAGIARRHPQAPAAQEHLAIDALVARRAPAMPGEARFRDMGRWSQVVTIFHHCVAGERARAGTLIGWIPRERRGLEPYRSFLSWASEACA